MPSDQSLAQLLKEARDFSDYQKVEARVAEQFISRDEVMGALLRLAERVEALESGQPEASPDPRPPTRPGDEFPTPSEQWETVQGSELRNWDQIDTESGNPGQPTWGCVRDNGLSLIFPKGSAWEDVRPDRTYRRLLVRSSTAKPTPTPPSKAVRVDSLPVGAECWVKATVEERVHGRVLAFGINGALYFVHDALVIPAEPSAEEYNGGMATLLPWEIEARRIHAAEKPIAEPIPRNDTGNSGSRTSPPTPIQLRVGHRYKRRDGVEVECIWHYSDKAGTDVEFRCAAGAFSRCFWADGRYLPGRHDSELDIIEDLGPVAEEAEKVTGDQLNEGDEVLGPFSGSARADGKTRVVARHNGMLALTNTGAGIIVIQPHLVYERVSAAKESEGVKPRPAWADDPDVDCVLRNIIDGKECDYIASSSGDTRLDLELTRRVRPEIERIARQMLSELEVKP